MATSLCHSLVQWQKWHQLCRNCNFHTSSSAVTSVFWTGIFYAAHLKTFYMSNKTSPKDNSANQQNSNKGTAGTNKQYDQNQGNRGQQMNPNQKGGQSSGGNQNQGARRNNHKTV
jgi:hypothetical protein